MCNFGHYYAITELNNTVDLQRKLEPESLTAGWLASVFARFEYKEPLIDARETDVLSH